MYDTVVSFILELKTCQPSLSLTPKAIGCLSWVLTVRLVSLITDFIMLWPH